jgi:hypothetical protein
MAKFVAFEKFSEAIYSVVDKNTLSDGGKTGVNLGSGLLAGFAAAIVSQPADTMLSKINKTQGLPGESTTSRLVKIAKELGLKGSFSGIGARLFMVSQKFRDLFRHYANIIRLVPSPPVSSPSTVTSSVCSVPLAVSRLPPPNRLLSLWCECFGVLYCPLDLPYTLFLVDFSAEKS